MTHWGTKQKKALCALFDEGVENPKQTGSEVVDNFFPLAKEFEGMKIERFRDNYRNCAVEYLMGKALNGIQCCESFFHDVSHMFVFYFLLMSC